MNKRYGLVVIGVNYRSGRETENWLKSLRAGNPGEEALAVVVDTSAEETDPELEGRL